MTRVALVGSGSIADTHLGALLDIPQAKVVGVYSRTEEKARKAAERAKCDSTTDWRATSPASDCAPPSPSRGSGCRLCWRRPTRS